MLKRKRGRSRRTITTLILQQRVVEVFLFRAIIREKKEWLGVGRQGLVANLACKSDAVSFHPELPLRNWFASGINIDIIV
jgi:hypothetical protein